MLSRKNINNLKLYTKLSIEQKEKAMLTWKTFYHDPFHPSLRNRIIEKTESSKLKCYEVTISENLKACYHLATKGEYLWFLIRTY